MKQITEPDWTVLGLLAFIALWMGLLFSPLFDNRGTGVNIV